MNLDSGKGSPFEFFTTNSWTHRGPSFTTRAPAPENPRTQRTKKKMSSFWLPNHVLLLARGCPRPGGRAKKFCGRLATEAAPVRSEERGRLPRAPLAGVT